MQNCWIFSKNLRNPTTGVDLKSGTLSHDGKTTSHEQITLEKCKYGFLIDRKTSTATFIKAGHDMVIVKHVADFAFVPVITISGDITIKVGVRKSMLIWLTSAWTP